MLPLLKCQITPLGVITHRLRTTDLEPKHHGEKKNAATSYDVIKNLLLQVITYHAFHIVAFLFDENQNNTGIDYCQNNLLLLK